MSSCSIFSLILITSCQRSRRSWVSRRKTLVQQEISLLLIAQGSFLSAPKWTCREWERLFLSSQYGCPAKHPGIAAKRATDVPGNRSDLTSHQRSDAAPSKLRRCSAVPFHWKCLSEHGNEKYLRSYWDLWY